jgi:heterotetrameric sarcosine oxidase delta subunit
MIIECPLCGPRDLREFTIKGSAVALDRPAPSAPLSDWDDYLHLRDNPAGDIRELWYHEMGCACWLVVARNTVTHVVTGVTLAAQVPS